MTVRPSSGLQRQFAELVPRSATQLVVSRPALRSAFTQFMELETVSTSQAAELLDVSESAVRDRITDDEFAGVTMEGGAWRIPISSLRSVHLAA